MVTRTKNIENDVNLFINELKKNIESRLPIFMDRIQEEMSVFGAISMWQ